MPPFCPVPALAGPARAGLLVAVAAGPYMEKLVKTVEQTAVLSVRDGEVPTVVRSRSTTRSPTPSPP